MSKSNNMTLWEIDQTLAYLLDNLYDEDGVIDEDIQKQIDALELTQEQKRENVALYIKNHRALAAAMRAEEQNLAARRRSVEKHAERLEQRLAASLGGERFETARVSVRWRRSEAVEVDECAELAWDDDACSRYIVYTHHIDKQALKQALKQGEEIPGARLVEHNNMQIAGVAR